MVNCEVKFDNNPNAIYFAGQTLSGVVEMTVDKPKKIRGLVLKIEGYAKVKWNEKEPYTYTDRSNDQNRERTGYRTVTYTGREDYVSSTSYLIGSVHGNEIELSPGQYRYNFQSLLPPQLPTSCEAEHGYIRYLVTVVLDRPWKFDLTYKVAFTVIKQLDLNYENPPLSIPVKMECSRTFCCWCCKTKPIFVAASIPMGGFVPGQIINVSIDINNESTVDFSDIRVTLRKNIVYYSQVPTRQVKVELSAEVEVRHGQIKRESKQNFTQQLLIPPLPPTNTDCDVLQVNYEVQVWCKGPTFSVHPVIILPITIGTVPLRPQQHLITMPYGAPSAPALTPPSAGFNNYDAMIGAFDNSPNPGGSSNSNGTAASAPPPSYFDAVFTETNGNAVRLTDSGEHSMGVKPFLPRYPVYSLSTLLSDGGSTSNNNNSSGEQHPEEHTNMGFVEKY